MLILSCRQASTSSHILRRETRSKEKQKANPNAFKQFELLVLNTRTALDKSTLLPHEYDHELASRFSQEILRRHSPWRKLIVAYARHMMPRGRRTILASHPVVQIIDTLFAQDGELDVQDRAERIMEVSRQVRRKSWVFSLDALLGLSQRAEGHGALKLLYLLRKEIIHHADLQVSLGLGSTRSKQSMDHAVHELFALLLDASFLHQDYKDVLLLYHQMCTNHTPPRSTRTYSKVLQALIHTHLSSSDTHEAILRVILSIVDQMLASRISISNHFKAVLVRGFGAVLRRNLRVQKTNPRDVWNSIGPLLSKLRGKNSGINAMTELAWADVIIGIQEDSRLWPGSPQRWLTQHHRYAYQPMTSPGHEQWSYSALIKTLVDQNWSNKTTRLPYDGTPVPRTLVEAHRIQLLLRHHLLMNDPRTALTYFQLLQNVAIAFRNITSLPHSKQSTQHLLQASAADLSKRIRGSYIRLVVYSVQSGQRDLVNDTLSSFHILPSDFEFYIRVWTRCLHRLILAQSDGQRFWSYAPSWSGRGGISRTLSILLDAHQSTNFPEHSLGKCLRKNLFRDPDVLHRITIVAIKHALDLANRGLVWRDDLYALLQVAKIAEFHFSPQFLPQIRTSCIGTESILEPHFYEIVAHLTGVTRRLTPAVATE
jgi:hypothetical protein